MKRTRRVEVIRYSRSTTISTEFSRDAEITSEQAVIDLLLGMPEIPIKEPSRTAQQTNVADLPGTVRPGWFRRFFKWVT